MKATNVKDLIDNELKRVQIQNHRNFPLWYKALDPYARQALKEILIEDVTLELILFAQNAPKPEEGESEFLSVIAGGNPNPEIARALTNEALAGILFGLDNFVKRGN
jgi:hypothetical protein